ncbi:unnamed protein product [Vitrella brassicaformis CCMP3155]|uniref:Bromodomain associated domain-containing protein n=1 Tax=Vitrella brassicaformis (strain CCMP3155) TaxID=1169540 RepID=A0A0G4FC82_VITBC|nr:unnamed protein product [Vitrella brassicaformis CCMP3155]|eukprot:CEM10795.1 unnamed protein product [Vitrella brassicaformis CCMP3155]
MTEAYARELFERVVCHALRHQGFTDAEEDVIHILADHTAKYLERLGRVAEGLCELNGRTDANMLDAVDALRVEAKWKDADFDPAKVDDSIAFPHEVPSLLERPGPTLIPPSYAPDFHPAEATAALEQQQDDIETDIMNRTGFPPPGRSAREDHRKRLEEVRKCSFPDFAPPLPPRRFLTATEVEEPPKRTYAAYLQSHRQQQWAMIDADERLPAAHSADRGRSRTVPPTKRARVHQGHK